MMIDTITKTNLSSVAGILGLLLSHGPMQLTDIVEWQLTIYHALVRYIGKIRLSRQEKSPALWFYQKGIEYLGVSQV
jgi:hypothetical protein